MQLARVYELLGNAGDEDGDLQQEEHDEDADCKQDEGEEAAEEAEEEGDAENGEGASQPSPAHTPC